MSDNLFDSNKLDKHDYAWTGLDIDKIDHLINKTSYNLFENKTEIEVQNPGLREISLMNDPQYIYYTARLLLGLELYPLQCAILENLWKYPFPMLVGSRGLSKCVVKDTMLITNNGIKTFEDLDIQDIPQKRQKVDLEAFGETGYRDIEYGFYNGFTKTKKIKTWSGRTIEGTYDHPLRVVRNGKIKWVKLQNIQSGDYLAIERKYEEWNHNSLDVDMAYMIGAMVGDGGWSEGGKNISFTNQDQQCIDAANVGLSKWNGTVLKLVNNGKDLEYIGSNPNMSGSKLKKLFMSDFGANSYNKDTFKCTPKIIFESSFDAIAAYLRGYADTDGCCPTESPIVEYSSKSRRLLEETQMLLLVLGINSKLVDQWNKKHQKYYYKLQISGNSLRVFNNKIGFTIDYKQRELDKYCKIQSNENVDLLPHELVLDKLLSLRELARDIKISMGHGYNYEQRLVSPYRLKKYCLSYETFGKVLDILGRSPSVKKSKDYQDLRDIQSKYYFYDKVESIEDSKAQTYDIHIDNKDHSFISNGFISHNTYSLAVYCLLRLALNQGIKIVCTGAAFRQSKLVFQYMEQLWKKAPVLRSIYNSHKDGISRGADQWTFSVGDSLATAIPLGNGDKVRGLRSNIIICDEFSCLRENTLVETDRGLVKIQELIGDENFKVINKNGEFEKPAKFVITPKTNVYEIKTKYGYTFDCSNKHRVLTTNGWKLGIDLTENDYIVYDNKYKWPTTTPDGLNEDLAWLLGCLVSEGYVNNKYTFTITNRDKDFIDRCHNICKKFGLNPKVDFREEYIDSRGWKCKDIYTLRCHSLDFRRKLAGLGLDYCIHYEKQVPWSILQSPRNIVVKFLSGLFEGDGSAFRYSSKGKKLYSVAYYTASKELCQQVQTLLIKFDILSQRLTRDSKLSDREQWMLRMNANEAIQITDLLNIDKFNNILDDFYYESKNDKSSDVFGTAWRKDRQKWSARVQYAGEVHYLGNYSTQQEAAQTVKDFLNSKPKVLQVKHVKKLPDQEHLYDFHLPETNSFYANGFVQHNSVPIEVYQIVIENFGAVSMNPIQNMRNMAKKAALLKEGMLQAGDEELYESNTNQSIISGTIGTQWEHFWEYLLTYKSIIHSRGQIDQVKEQSTFSAEVLDGLDHKDFAIMRIPYDLIPDGFLDSKTVNRARATMHSAVFNSEYGTVPISDTSGFFKLSHIHSATASPKNLDGDYWPDYCPETFNTITHGSNKYDYVIAVDPASESDNFAIVVLELRENHTRVVYGWTTTKGEFTKKNTNSDEKNFFAYCCRHIRNLMKKFKTAAIVIDSQGGGYHIAEGLHDNDKLEPGELPLWPVIDEDKPKDTDEMPGLHILHLFQPSDAKVTSDANWSLMKDIQDKLLLFPYFDSVALGLENERVVREITEEADQIRVYNEYEDAALEIEELKKELTYIEYSKTSAGREKWDAPGIQQGNKKIQKLRKDRYSALMMGNYIARNMARSISAPAYSSHPSCVGVVGGQKLDGDQLAYGNQGYVSQLSAACFRGVQR